MTRPAPIGHAELWQRFRRFVAAGRLASTYLFVGPSGVGKRRFAEHLAQSLLCEKRPEAALDPCGACASCQQVLAGTHPDLLVVAKPADRSSIPIELLIGSGDKRMQEGLCHDLGLTSFMGRRKIALIDDADYLQAEAANCLLKTLEEPPPKSLLILIGTSLERQLPTIRSRAQLIRFQGLAPAELATLLVQQEIASDPDEALRLAQVAGGSLTRARELADAEFAEQQGRLVQALARRPLDALSTARLLAEFVEQSSTEAQGRRERLRRLLAGAADFYRRELRETVGGAGREVPAAESGGDAWLSDEQLAGCDRLLAAVDHCLVAMEQVDRNAHLQTIAEAWLDELQRLESS